MAREVTKTNPIGVRFDKGLLESLTLTSIVDSPQKALNLYEKSYLELVEIKVKMNNKPEKKEEILKEREASDELVEGNPNIHYKNGQPYDISECTPIEHKIDNSEVLKQIAAIKAEKIPSDRNTSLGKRVWQNEKDAKIRKLQSQLR